MSSDVDYNFQTNLKDDPDARLGFIRKVYSILFTQLLITVLFCVGSVTSKTFSDFQINNLWIFYVAIVLSFVTCIALFCFRQIARTVPTNYILALIFTLCEAWTISTICGLSDPMTVLIAASLTAAITLGLTVYAYTTKSDFTTMGGMLLMALFLLIMMGILMIFIQSRILTIIYCTLGVFIFGIYLIYDTQLIVGGKRYELSIDDYIIGALALYIDIINIFLYILQLLNSR
mmetsp:Transcript_49741/g.57070  ORF Transcript_49741/g.57070 Transcript_49741/m.57070 type:complete len:232 (-) Transcript_49741:228-923(-)|eukprot:CAMPEP_0114971732 /NCGR_PEP_ID=MMETSP0216-20121206/10_1 /TAXON_ID=223996 /ORGANISM="Protocruzia adherens, Strain Boccale" /LENGTH=231 /DNA_ID=CAMNT_0002332041 /DNA_START=141 /DNA_END=836 /DNA_ORIENTATION=-